MSSFRSPLLLLLSLVAGLSLLSSSSVSGQSLTFANYPYNTNASWVFGSIDQWVRPLNQPITYVTNWNAADNDNAWSTAPAGSYFLWGTQPDMSISTDLQTWWYTSGTADTNAHIDSRDIPLNFPNVVTQTAGTIAPGNALCNHRTSFNRFYLMGNVNTKTSPYAPNTTSPANGNANVNTYFAWVTNDGQIWNQVMANASSYGMAQQRLVNTMVYPFCVVDQKERVYLVGGADTWMSVDLAVNWNKVTSTSYPTPARYATSGAIYSPTASTDTIVMIGGQATAGQHLNDVWSSTNGGVTWSNLGNGPWSPRRDGVFAINNNGVMVYLGGSCGGGYCGVYSDAYVSVNGGSQWYMLAVAPTVNINITLAASVFDAQGYLWLVTGQTAYGTNNYNWTSTIQKSSLSFSTSAITSWSSTYTGGQQFTTSATAINSLNLGAWPQGGAKYTQATGIVPISSFTCVNTLLPTDGPFNMSQLDSGNGWGTSDVMVVQTVQPIVYQNPWSASGTVIDPYTGYWIGSSWSVAPAGSWVLWGSNPDVAISTNLGTTWSTIAGIGGAGLGTQATDYYNAPFGTDAGFGNAECAHRASFNRFYIIGNSQPSGNSTSPFFAWAANEAQTWSQVMDAASGAAMAASPGMTDCVCWVDGKDVVYFMGSTAIFMSSTLGQIWSKMTSSNFPPARQFMASLIFAPTATTETVLMLGGVTTAGMHMNDVWSTTNNGQSWTQVAANAAFSPRASPQMAIAANGAIVLHGGMMTPATGTPTYYSDLWVTVNYGSTWFMLTSASPVGRSLGSGIIDPFGYFYVDSGRSAAKWGESDVWKSTLSINNIALWGPKLIPGFSTPSSFACTQGSAPVVFDFVNTAGSPGWGAIDQYIRVSNVPTGYVTGYGGDNINNWGVAPAGSWLLFGTQPDISVSTNNGKTWTITSGTASSNSHLDTRDIPANFPASGNAGNAGCAHRTTFNRFYLIGNVASGSTPTSPWFSWATHDGTIWYQVMNNASSYAMSKRVGAAVSGNYGDQCFVDQKENVYSVGGTDTWRSSDLGVSWTAVSASAYFPTRVNFAGAVYSPSATQDTMVILGGENAQDCWQTVNGGASWTMVSSALPWGNRGNLNFGVSQNNVFVVMGGDCRSASCGPNGFASQSSPGLTVYNDVWLSVSYGATWYQVNAATTAPVLSLAAVAFDAQGYMYLVSGQGNGYGSWTSAQYRSTLSLLNVTTWAPKLSTGTAFTPASSYASPTSGAYSLGGPKGSAASAIVPLSTFACGPASNLPVASKGSSFDFAFLDNTNGWGTSDIGLAVIPSPITYEVPYSNSSYGTYWQGNAWATAPAGSWLIWGSNPDVTISTDQGASWLTIAGISGAGFPTTSSSDYAPSGALLYNAECAHRSQMNRFYIIGNNDPIGTYTVAPFFAWASDDGLTWTQVMDNATSWNMAVTKDINSGACVVGMNDVVYYIGGSAMWQSSNLGTLFTPITPSAGAATYLNGAALGYRESHTAVIFSPTPGKESIVVVGGGGQLNRGFANDVWQTTDYGTSWQALTTSAGWSPRQNPQVAIGMNGVMVLYGGMAWTNSSTPNAYGWSWFSDVWVSLNGGSQWYQLTANSAAGPRAYGGMVVDKNGYLFVSSGSSIWSNWLASAYRSQYSLYNIQQWLPITNPSIPIPAALCPGTTPGGGGSSSSSLSGGAIAGIVIGSVAGALLLCLILFVLVCRRGGEKKATSYEAQPEHSQVTQSEGNTTHEMEMAETQH